MGTVCGTVKMTAGRPKPAWRARDDRLGPGGDVVLGEDCRNVVIHRHRG
jgi:hypothetical protein